MTLIDCPICAARFVNPDTHRCPPAYECLGEWQCESPDELGLEWEKVFAGTAGAAAKTYAERHDDDGMFAVSSNTVYVRPSGNIGYATWQVSGENTRVYSAALLSDPI